MVDSTLAFDLIYLVANDRWVEVEKSTFSKISRLYVMYC